MNGKNPEALAQAFKAAKAKKLKIKELGIKPKMTDTAKDKLIKKLAISKAETLDDGSEWKDHVKGQRWYVESLIEFSAIPTNQEMLDYEYSRSFADCASEEEMINALDEI